MGRQGARQQPDRLLDLGEAPLPQAVLVQRVPAQEVIAKRLRGPDAELGARFDLTR